MFLRSKTLISLYIIAFILISSFISYGATYTYDNLNRLTKVDYHNGTIEEYAYDAAGNRLSLITTVDTTPPETTITSNPPNPTNSNSASFSFTSTETGSTFQCQLDGGGFTPCTCPKTYTSLTEGSHTFEVKATDIANNTDPTPASYTWIIDNSKPTSTITSPINGSAVIGTTFIIRGTASDAVTQVQKVEISINSGAWTQVSGTTSWSHVWTIPSDGTYTIKSRATDSVGNVEIPSAGVTIYSAVRQPIPVTVDGRQILVNGNPFAIKGVGYSPVPIGVDPETTPPYGDYFTSDYNSIYNRDLPLLRQMGTNTIRLWGWNNTANHVDFLDKAYNSGVNPIYVIAGFWVNAGLNIDPTSPDNVRERLKADFREMVAAHKNHPAILMWAIGNGLNADWMYGGNLNHLFSLIDEMAEEAHAEEGTNYHPVTTPLADDNLINTIAAYDPTVLSLNIWGANVYHGNTFGTLFNDYKAVSQKPLAILEYGIDAYDNVHGDEYEKIGIPYQADYAASLWSEIEANSDVCIGGSIMAYSDEWWKGKYSTDLGCPDNDPAVHSTCGYTTTSHPDGYANEEWWGIMRIADNGNNPDIMEPRAVYYTLQNIWVPINISVNPTSKDFGNINVGSQSAPQTFTISNTGLGNLVISSIGTTGGDAGMFSVAMGGTNPCPSLNPTITPGSNCTITVTFSPTSVGPKSTNLRINSNDPETPNLNVPLSGTGIVHAVTCSFTPGGTTLIRGGTLRFWATGSNDSDDSQTFQFATFVTLPNGHRHPTAGWLFGPIPVTLGPHTSKYKSLTQFIPYNAPFGTYIYHGYVGKVGVGLYNQCQFNFTVNP